MSHEIQKLVQHPHSFNTLSHRTGVALHESDKRHPKDSRYGQHPTDERQKGGVPNRKRQDDIFIWRCCPQVSLQVRSGLTWMAYRRHHGST